MGEPSMAHPRTLSNPTPLLLTANSALNRSYERLSPVEALDEVSRAAARASLERGRPSALTPSPRLLEPDCAGPGLPRSGRRGEE